jgi:uncharacterized protein
VAKTSYKYSRRKSAAKRSSPFGKMALSLAAVAIALALLVGVLLVRGAPSTTPQAEPPEAATQGTSPIAGSSEESSAPALAPSPVLEPKDIQASAPQGESATIAKPASGKSPAVKEKPSVRKVSYTSRPEAKPSLVKPKQIALVIDDAGYNMKQLGAFLRLPFPIAVAVLPGLPHSEEAAKAVLAAGKELLLHQPMQPVGGQDPGPGAITLGMSREDIEACIEANLATVPGAVGINNHMGSAASADEGIMEAVLTVAKRHGIYYLDSRTTSETTIKSAARREGIRYWERDVFLDNTPDRASITRAVEDGKKRSEKDRPAIMIGHVWSAELAQTLTDLYPQLVAEGYSLSTISRFMLQETIEDDDSPRD